MKNHTPLSIALLLLVGPSLVSGAQEVESSSPDSSPGIIASYPEASTVWRRFIASGHYRLAIPADFELAADQCRPYGDGDFNRDKTYFDFAVIVVDTLRSDASRFGLLIFNKRKNSTGYEGPFWLYRGTDLSRTSLNTISHGPLIVAERPDDGKGKVCVVNWNQSKRRYFCARGYTLE